MLSKVGRVAAAERDDVDAFLRTLLRARLGIDVDRVYRVAEVNRMLEPLHDQAA